MKNIDELMYTGNSFVYNRARKKYLEDKGKINCGYCPYHKNENMTGHRFSRSWKRHRKTQYKCSKVV